MLKNHKFALIIFGVILVTALVLRILSTEDDWLCQDGRWVRHGNPRSSQPTSTCPGATANLETTFSPPNSSSETTTPPETVISPATSTSSDSAASSTPPATLPESETELQIVKPQPDGLVRSPYEVSGLAPGNWFFEATLPVKLYDNQGQEIVSVPAPALSDWMTTALVPFTADLTFKTKATSGYLVIRKDNPSGLPANDAEYRIPVRFH